MQTADLVDVLHRINRKRAQPVDEELLDQVLALVIKNPLDEDRAHCQEQIKTILYQRIGGGRNAN